MARKLFGMLAAAVVLAVSFPGFAQDLVGTEPTVGLGDVGLGSLLFETETPGRFVTAPVQSTEVEIEVRGLVVEAVVRQRFSNPSETWLEGVYVFLGPAP